VQAAKISLLRQGKRTAFIVTVTNNGKKAVSDLPILVGYRGAGGGVFVNGAVGTDYFASHLPLIAAGASACWVATTIDDVPSAAHPLTEIGARPTVTATGLTAPPTVSATARTGSGGDVLNVTVHNGSGVTQYGLPLYAVADAAGRAVAAGTASVTQLNGNATRTVHIHLLGRAAGHASVQVHASPTIFN
jgi:hypothetical protein